MKIRSRCPWHGCPGHDTELDRFANFVSTEGTYSSCSVFSRQRRGGRPGSARFQLPACPECLMLAGGMRSQGRNLLGAELAASCYSWQALPSMRRVKELLGLMQRPVLAEIGRASCREGVEGCGV